MQITQLASIENAVAMTVWGLMTEQMALLGRGINKARALEMYQKSGDHGDLFGLIHAGKMLLVGGDGVERKPNLSYGMGITHRRFTRGTWRIIAAGRAEQP